MGKKIGLVTGTVQNVGTFSGIFKTCLDLTPKKKSGRISLVKEGNFATESLRAPTLWHRMFRTILEMETIFMAKTVKRAFFVKKKAQLNWHSAVHVCPFTKSLGHPRHRPTRWFFNGSWANLQGKPNPHLASKSLGLLTGWVTPKWGAPFPGQEAKRPMISAPRFPVISYP